MIFELRNLNPRGGPLNRVIRKRPYGERVPVHAYSAKHGPVRTVHGRKRSFTGEQELLLSYI
jgi:hypothetical protein